MYLLLTYLLAYLLTCLLTYLLTYLLAYLLTYLLTYLRTCLLSCLLTAHHCADVCCCCLLLLPLVFAAVIFLWAPRRLRAPHCECKRRASHCGVHCCGAAFAFGSLMKLVIWAVAAFALSIISDAVASNSRMRASSCPSLAASTA